jgi:hypothetical protein
MISSARRHAANSVQCVTGVLANAGHEVNEAGAAGTKYRQIMSMKLVHLLAIWALVYVGVEFTLGGPFIIEPLLWSAEQLHRLDGDIHRARASRRPIRRVHLDRILRR